VSLIVDLWSGPVRSSPVRVFIFPQEIGDVQSGPGADVIFNSSHVRGLDGGMLQDSVINDAINQIIKLGQDSLLDKIVPINCSQFTQTLLPVHPAG